MALSEFERMKAETEARQFIEPRRPPKHIRDQLDLGFKVENQSVILFEVRPRWNNPEERMELPFAKATYIKTSGIWKVYWRRADLKWHGYKPAPEARYLTDFLKIVEEDEYGCFWG